MKQFVLIVGNLSEGFRFYGPFESMDLADDAARRFDDTWIAEMYQNEDDELHDE